MCNKLPDHITAVFFIGNYYLSDDGLGIHLYNMFKSLTLPENVELHEYGLFGLAQMDHIKSFKKLIIVDALKGIGKPGEIFTFDLLVDSNVFHKPVLSAHHFGIMEILELIRKLNPCCIPKKMLLMGAETEISNVFSTSLTQTLEATLDDLKKMILKEL